MLHRATGSALAADQGMIKMLEEKGNEQTKPVKSVPDKPVVSEDLKKHYVYLNQSNRATIALLDCLEFQLKTISKHIKQAQKNVVY